MENSDDVFTNLLSVSITSLNKPDLVAKCKEFQDAIKHLLEEKKQPEPSISGQQITGILERLTSLEQSEAVNARNIKVLQTENICLKKRVSELEGFADDVDSRFVDIEKSVIAVEQYTRRENFEISGIPLDLPHNELKAKVIAIANTITERTDDPITPKDIHACHRLKEDNGQASVIVRMVNREDTISILKSKKKLPDKSGGLGFQEKLYINENLCSGTKDIFSEVRKLKKKGVISSCWTFNGIVHFKKKDTDRFGKKIFHLADLENHFTLAQLGWD